ncbi:MAG: hypothetical protein KIT84_23635 [Labilithrix sp.]|nr:hypothetical protein [Labilithrix sp.]MCW5814041.1 hypothetical protein [Labilithrix sp.]
MKVERASVWAEAVFHVLAHVDVPFASSCFDPVYIAWIRERLGRPVETLAHEMFALTHDTFARAQALAWVFGSADENRRWSDRDLDEIEVHDDEALHVARAAGAFAEVLRATAELEMPDLEALAPAPFDAAALERALHAVLPAAPALAGFTVAVTPPLPRRGRVHRRVIFAGVPGVAGATNEHVAWQAAHEATVVEAARDHDAFLAVEREAIQRLRARAGAAGLAGAHAAWLATLDLRALGPL